MTVKLATADLASEKIIANLLLNFSKYNIINCYGVKVYNAQIWFFVMF